MPWTIDYLDDMGIICIENSGEVSFAEIRDQTIRGLQLAREHNCKRCLSDCSAMTSQLRTLEIHQIVELYNELAIPHDVRIAVLMPSSITQPLEQDYYFYETVARNQSYEVKLFKSKPAAIDWLTDDLTSSLEAS